MILTNASPTNDDDDVGLWAHRDQGVAAYLIAGGTKLLLVADVHTRHPLFVFGEPAGSRVLEHAVTHYRLHTLDSFKHCRPHRVRAWAMACADQQLDALIASARDEGLSEIEVPEDMIWIWLPTDEERAGLSEQDQP